MATDLHICVLDAVPPVLIVTNHVDIISLPLQMAESTRRAQPVSAASHVKARQSLIEHAVAVALCDCCICAPCIHTLACLLTLTSQGSGATYLKV